MTRGFVFFSKREIYQMVNLASVSIKVRPVHATLHDKSGEAMIIRLFKIRVDGTHPSDSINSRFFPKR